MEQSTSLLPQVSLKDGLVGDWRCNEGYGAIAFDYAKSNNGILGGSDGLEAQPEWVVSGITTSNFNFIKSQSEIPLLSSSESQDRSNLLAKFVR